MAYKNLVNQTITSREEFLMRWRDFVCARNATYNYSTTGIGWNYIDSSYSVDEDNMAVGDWFVISSTGENNQEQMYYKFDIYSTSYIRAQQFLYYDPVTHTGTQPTTNTNMLRNSGAWTKMSIYGNLDYVMPIFEYSASTSNHYGAFFGKILSEYDEGIQTVTGTLTAGSDVSIVIEDTSSPIMEVDRYIFVHDNTNIERALIKTNNGSTTLTVDLVNSYTTGARIRSCWPYSIDTAYSGFLVHSQEIINLAGTLNYSYSTIAQCFNIVAGYANPGAQGQIRCTPYSACSNTANVGHTLGYPNIYKGILQSSLTLGDVLVDKYGNNYRLIYISSLYWYIKEV